MGRKKERLTQSNQNLSPKDFAIGFWRAVNNRQTIRTVKQLYPYLPINERNKIVSYLKKFYNQPSDIEIDIENEQEKQYELFIKPYLPMDKVNLCLRDLRIPAEKIDKLIFILMPLYIETILFPQMYPPLIQNKKEREIICKKINERKKQLSRLKGQLKKVQENDLSFAGFEPVAQTINKIEFEIAYGDEIVKMHKAKYKILQINKDLNKSPQKHSFWNKSISNAVEIMNLYCHNSTCDKRKCGKTHEKAYRKIADFLKILHPKIWKEDRETIAKRIKQKYYRSLSS